MKKTKQLTATKFRILLAVLLIAALVLPIAGFGFARTYVDTYATTVGELSQKADASDHSLQTLQQLSSALESRKDVLKRTESIVAASQSYQYQDQIIEDLSSYAAQTGISISQFTFNAAGTGAATTAPTTPPPAGGAPTTPGAPAVGGGIKSTSVTITLKTPVSYTNLLRFVRAIENNLTKMQLSNLSLSRAETGGAGAVSTQTLTVEVYVK